MSLIRNRTHRIAAATLCAALLLVIPGCSRSATSSEPTGTTFQVPSKTITSEEIQRRQEQEQRKREQDEAEARERERRAAAVRKDPVLYDMASEQEFALIARNPDAHKGKKIQIFGVVTQFDIKTGESTFRANTSSGPQTNISRTLDAGFCGSEWCIPTVNDASGYDVNSVIIAPAPEVVANVVEGDFVRMYVEVVGSTTYETRLGTEAAPVFAVYIIDACPSEKYRQNIGPSAQLPDVPMQPACEEINN